MADVIYKRGLSQDLDNVAPQDGQILVTTDKGEMYIDVSDGRKKITDTTKMDKFGEVDTENGTITLLEDMSTITSKELKLNSESNTIELIQNPTLYEYDITVVGNASSDWTSGVLDSLEYEGLGGPATLYIPEGGCGCEIRNTEHNRSLPDLPDILVPGTEIELSRSPLETGDATLRFYLDGAGVRVMTAENQGIQIASGESGSIGIKNSVDTMNMAADTEIVLDTTSNTTYIHSKELVLFRPYAAPGSEPEVLVRPCWGYVRITDLAEPKNDTDAVTKEYVDRLDNVLKDIRDAIHNGGTTAQTVAEIEQLITNYLETKTVAEVEE